MIETDSLGNDLETSFTSRLQERALSADRGPKEQIFFARKVDDFWNRRDVSSMFFQANPISKSIAQNYGTSSGAEVELIFDNSPYPVVNYTLQTGGKVYGIGVAFQPNITLNGLPLRVGDWIEISDYENIEQRRIDQITPINATSEGIADYNYVWSVVFSDGLDNDYDLDYTEVRYLFAIHPTKDRLDTHDLYNGSVQMNLGFQGVNQYLTLYQGEITGGQRDPNKTVTLTTQDIVKHLVETQLTARFEVDDRGVASVPTARGWNNENIGKTFDSRFGASEIPNEPNIGTGMISDIAYTPNKLDEIRLEDEWILTYNGKTEHWFIWGRQYGATNTDGYGGSGPTGEREWPIDLADLLGWSVVITEGFTPFVHGDQFSFFTKAYQEGNVHLVKGRGFETITNPISTLGLEYLNPSYIIEFLIESVLEIQHENINVGNGDESDLLVKTDSIRELDLDFRTELRGSFGDGTPVIQVIDDALRAVNGWAYSTHDDHLALFYYSPFAFGDYGTNRIQTDYSAPRVSAIYPNAADPQVEPRVVDSVKNQVFFRYANGEVFVDDADSQENFGVFKLDVRGEDLITHQIASGFQMSENTARNAAYRALNRYKNPIFRAMFVGLPSLLLLEIGDIPIVFSRESQFVNKPFWVTGLEVDFVNCIVIITGEFATQIVGKFGISHDSDTPSANEIWDDTGFIGDLGEERLVFVADDTEELALLTGASTYSARLGLPDRWGNYVHDAFIVA